MVISSIDITVIRLFKVFPKGGDNRLCKVYDDKKRNYPSRRYPLFLWVSPLFFPLAKFFLCTTAISLVPKGFVPRIGYITILIAFVMVINITSSFIIIIIIINILGTTTINIIIIIIVIIIIIIIIISTSSSSQSQKLVCIYTYVCLLYIPDNSSAVGSLHFLHCIFQL